MGCAESSIVVVFGAARWTRLWSTARVHSKEKGLRIYFQVVLCLAIRIRFVGDGEDGG